MDELGTFLSGVGSVLWPTIAILAFLLLRVQIAELLQSAKSRKFTIKIGGQELTMEEATHQAQVLIEDLQSQVVQLKTTDRSEHADLAQPNVDAVSSTLSLLWVDDNPKNNIYVVEHLRARGATVQLALSTDEALAHFGRRRYTAVISDMARGVGTSYNDAAGIDLIGRIRSQDKTIPIIIFSSSRAVTTKGGAAFDAGANLVTSSATELLAELTHIGLQQ
jgi:CheY-like chemotaxis protein